MRSEQAKQRQRQSKKKEYWWYRRHGICVYCHQTDAVPGMQACADCFYKRQMRRIAKSSEEERAKQAEQRRQWRAKHKAEGLCSECNQPAIDGLTRCRKHQILHNASSNKVHVIPDLTRCSLVACNEPAVAGKRFCEKHYKEKCAVIMANQPKSNANHIWRKLDHAVYEGRRKRDRAGGSADQVKGAGS
jgi:hypothetical protein